MYCNGQLECLLHMAQTLSVDCTAHSPSDGPIWGQWWWQETLCRGRWSPGGSIRFQLSSLHHWPIADPRTLAQLCLHPYISNWHVGIYDTGSIQGFRKAETMMGREQMPHIKLSGECFHVSRGRVGSFICTNPPVSSCHRSEAHPQSCQVLSQRGRGCLLLDLQSDIFSFSHHPPCP